MASLVYHPVLLLLSNTLLLCTQTSICTLPVTSCLAERSFSGLKRTKTAFRSSMATQRLTNLSLLSIHRDILVDIQAAIDEFSRRHPRRLQLTDILAD